MVKPKQNALWAVAGALEDAAMDLEAQGSDGSFARRQSINIAELAFAQAREI